MSAMATDGNVHIYNGNVPPSSYLPSRLSAASMIAPGLPMVLTETGYDTMTQDHLTGVAFVNEDVQAKFILDTYLDAYQLGAATTYVYELLDEYADPADTNHEDHWGLFNSDGTPKEAAIALHDLTAILGDHGSSAETFAAGSLNYSVSNLPKTGNDMLMEKSNGAFDIVVWNEAQLWNQTNNSEYSVAPTTVTVSLGNVYQTVEVFDPLIGSTPVETLQDVNSVSIGLTDHPLIVEVEPGILLAAPVSTGSGSDILVLNISEDAWANGDGTSDANGDAAFTVSVDGKQLAGTFYATASHSAGASQTFTFMGNWAPGTHTVAVDFLNDAYGGTASTDRNLYVNDVTFDGTDTKQSAALMSSGSQSFSVTDSTAIPPAVTGGGADSLLVKVSEDYYLANAQFTVSVDGKQLGGTNTATTLHSSGNSQTFAFAGDFGSGQHTVSVKFLNDAWAGTAATDRNLYVNDIVYNGTDTKLSAALMANGAKTFSISGGTTPSVSETGDHGSLSKNLSQTGTYTVGGDTFVLGNGNADTVTLGTGTSQIKFVGPSSVTLTGGSGQAAVTADAGSNKFVAGSGSLDVTGGAGKDAYVFHSTSGLITLEDFSMAKGDTLTIDKSLQSSLHEASDGIGGVMLSFGTTGHGVDIHGVAAMPSSNITWA